jgi:uncharacterized membrane protein
MGDLVCFLDAAAATVAAAAAAAARIAATTFPLFVHRYRAEDKKKLESDFEKESQRSATQVLSCSVIGCVIAAACVHFRRSANIAVTTRPSSSSSSLS